MTKPKTSTALAAPAVKTEPAIKLLQTQRDWVLDKSRFKLGMFSRQTGKTFAATLECVDDVHQAESTGKRSPWVILSRGERQAYQAMREGVYRHLHAYGIGLKTLSENEIDFYDEDQIKRRGLELVFPKGNYIVAIPANPDTARGYSANMLFDEFAFHKDSRAIWGAAFPIITRGYKARVISTPNGKGNKFYDLATSDDAMWRKYTMDIYEAVRQGAPLNLDELKRGVADEDVWAQEYDLQWLDEASAWLSYDLINAVENDHAGLPHHYNNGAVFVGVDIATRRDLFVIWVAELVGDVLWTREIIAKRHIIFAEMDFHLDGVFQRYNVNRCVIDQTGMGEKFVEDAQRRHGNLRIEGVLFTSPNKLTLATLGKTAFQDRKIRIPQGDDALRADLHKVKQETSATGTPRFVADSDSAGHADRFWAMCMAVHAAGKQAAPIDYVSVPKTSTARHEAVSAGGYSDSNDFEQD
jgi:phage FluMu gp28-like protein